jgi:hypothetical protein
MGGFMASLIARGVRKIMHDYDNIVRERQKAIRRQIDERKLSIKAIHLDAGWENSSSLLSYFPADEAKEPATMSVAALFRLLDRKALPPDLLSILLPDSFVIIRKPEGIDHDEIAKAFADYLAAKNDAHRIDSECGPAIGPREQEALDAKVVHLPLGRVA